MSLIDSRLKGLAARCGRTYRSQANHKRACQKLREYMETLGTGELGYWRKIEMIDHRWCGATGAGAYWAVELPA